MTAVEKMKFIESIKGEIAATESMLTEFYDQILWRKLRALKALLVIYLSDVPGQSTTTEK